MHKFKYFQNEFPNKKMFPQRQQSTHLGKVQKSSFVVLELLLTQYWKIWKNRDSKTQKAEQSQIIINSNQNVFDFKVQNFICRKVFLYFGVLYYYFIFGKCGIFNFTKNKLFLGWWIDHKLKNNSKTQMICSVGTH